MKKTTNKVKKVTARTTTAQAATPETGYTNIVKAGIAFTRKFFDIGKELAEGMEEEDLAHFKTELAEGANYLMKPKFERFLRFLGIVDGAGNLDRGRFETAAKVFEMMQRTGGAKCFSIGPVFMDYRAVNAALRATA